MEKNELKTAEKLTVYTSSTCPKCSALKDRLKEANIEFVEKNTDIDDLRLELYRLGKCTVPSVFCVSADGSEQVLEDADIDRLIETKMQKQ